MTGSYPNAKGFGAYRERAREDPANAWDPSPVRLSAMRVDHPKLEPQLSDQLLENYLRDAEKAPAGTSSHEYYLPRARAIKATKSKTA